MLLSSGADVTLQNDSGESVLEVAGGGLRSHILREWERQGEGELTTQRGCIAIHTHKTDTQKCDCMSHPLFCTYITLSMHASLSHHKRGREH